jgi:hypothetical protein
VVGTVVTGGLVGGVDEPQQLDWQHFETEQ